MYAIQTPKTDDKVDSYTDKAVIACRQNTFVWNSGAERVCKMKTSVWKHQETFPYSVTLWYNEKQHTSLVLT